MRLPLYFYSNKNLVGSGLSVCALSAYLTGFVNEWWFLIVAGAYAIGALATPENAQMNVEMNKDMHQSDVQEGLQKIAARAPAVLPTGIADDVVEICGLLYDALPSLEKSTVMNPVAYDVKMTATEYLPQTLDAYLQLPSTFRAIGKSADGKSPTEMLAEQVSLLKGRLHDLTSSIASEDASKLAQNGRFLREHFATAGLNKEI